METENDREMMEALFINMVAGLYSQTMQYLGKIMNPVTGKIEENLEIARANIEILRMLKIKTMGNLNDKESRSIHDALSNMQMNYVDMLGKRKNNKKGESPGKNSE